MSEEGKKPRVLLLEDEAIVAMTNGRALSSTGFEVVRAPTGEAAIELCASSEPFDILVADIDLGPGMDGVEAARKIRRIEDLPVVFLTSFTEEEVSRRAADIGRYGYVNKDCERERLIEAVSQAAF
jgi:FOG: CheY-like receiver